MHGTISTSLLSDCPVAVRYAVNGLVHKVNPRLCGGKRKNLKGLKKENLRDNMSTTEIVLNMLAEASTKDISQAEAPETFAENQQVARKGGEVAGIARQALEARTGRPVITPQNALDFHRLIEDVMEETAALPETEQRRE